MPQCGRVCPSVGGYAPVWEGVPQCGRVCPSVGGCAYCGRVCLVWEGVPSVGGCAPVREGMLVYM